LRRYALPVGLELTPLRFDTTPMSSEVHGNGLGGRRQSRRGDPLGGFAVIDVHDFRTNRGNFSTFAAIRRLRLLLDLQCGLLLLQPSIDH
jgi:hypothetical protein